MFLQRSAFGDGFARPTPLKFAYKEYEFDFDTDDEVGEDGEDGAAEDEKPDDSGSPEDRGSLDQFHSREVTISEDGFGLDAVVSVPAVARGVVIFAHGTGSDRFSPRSQYLARKLYAEGYATIAVDLLTEEEAHDRMNVFDIDLLASRLTMVARYTNSHPRFRSLPLALAGSNAGAAAALKAAAQLGDRVQAVISRAGRPDLASDILEDVLAPTLLIVGSEDTPIVSMNEWVLPRMKAIHELAIIEGADHLFEEEGALEKVATLAITWLDRFLKTPGSWKSAYSRANQAYII